MAVPRTSTSRTVYGSATYDSRILTIEHVLPQTVAAGSQLEKWWPDEDQRWQWLHKIGNLLPLAKRTNSQAQNYDFDVKKEKYFMGKAGVAAYALTTQVLSHDIWTPEIVEKRQKELLPPQTHLKYLTFWCKYLSFA